VFALNETAHVIGEGSPELIMEAAETCPSVAIAVFDQETGEQVYP
jgi:ferredoxin